MTNYYNGYRVHGEEKSISFFNFIKHVFKHWYIVIALTLLTTVIAYLYTTLFVTPTYSSNAKLYILSRQSEKISTNDLYIANELSKDYMELITDEVILEPVAKAMKGKYSLGTIRSFVKVKNPLDTRFLEITVTSPNAKDSKKMVDLICKFSQEIFIDVLEVDKVTVIRNGRVPSAPSSPNLFQNLAIGALFGIMSSISLIFLLFVLNDTIKYAEDVEKSLDLNVLATIPYSSNSKSHY